MRGVPLLMACSLVAAASAAAAESPLASSGIRDIHSPLPVGGFPPFAASLIVILVGIAWAMSRAVGRRPVQVRQEEKVSAASEFLEELRRKFEGGEISCRLLCDRLARLLGSGLTAGDNQALTSVEVIAAATGCLSVETVKRAAGVLEFCDRVRFGGDRPVDGAVLAALDESGLVLHDLGGRQP